MKAFTIDAENNIVFHASAKAAPKTEGTELFASERALAELAAAWPTSRLIEIWNSIPGVTPIKKFTDRKKAVTRIWKAIQNLGEAEAPQSAHVAPEKAPAKKKASRANKAPIPATKAKGSREGSKTATVLELLRRKGGVTAKELMTATGWQAHSVRGQRTPEMELIARSISSTEPDGAHMIDLARALLNGPNVDVGRDESCGETR